MTLLIVNGDLENRKKRALELAEKTYHSSSFDITFITNSESNFMTLNQVKEARQKAKLKPFNSENKTIIFFELNKATVEAQNALLKLVEEPPNHTYLILTSPSENLLLPPIISRCAIISLKEHKLKTDDQTLQTGLEEAVFLFSGSIKEKMEKAEKLSKDHQALISYLENLISTLRLIIFSKLKIKKTDAALMVSFKDLPLKNLISVICKLQKALLAIKNTNANTRLLLENLLLELIPN